MGGSSGPPEELCVPRNLAWLQNSRGKGPEHGLCGKFEERQEPRKGTH